MEYLSNLIEKPVSGEWGDEGNKIPVIRSTNFTMDGFLDLSDVKFRDIDESKIAKKKLQRGDIIIEKSGGSLDQPVGRVVFFDEEGDFLFSNFTSALRPKKDKVFPKYLNYMLLSAYKGNITSYFQNRTTGIINLQLTRYVDELQIPLPPLATQQKIAAALDKADAIRKRSQLILSKYDQLAQSVFLEMFGDPVKNEKGWEVKRLGDFGTFKNGLNYGKDDLGFEIKCIGVGDFKSKYKIDDFKDISSISLSALPSNEYFLKNGDLIFVRSNGNKDLVGRCVAVYPQSEQVSFSGFCIRLRIDNKSLLTVYLTQLFRNARFKKSMLNGGRGANIQNINQQILTNLKLCIPPIGLQNKFANIITQIEKQKAQTQLELDRAEELYQSLLQQAFTGELFPETSPRELTHT
ncbi:restriction endonuclease subunit S [Algoriphagus sp.]|uniref:restriction endonuclease subunit S n=1 Tax=Algoriphagus sp. TaxID=1872435 RepID=UPI003F6E9D01